MKLELAMPRWQAALLGAILGLALYVPAACLLVWLGAQLGPQPSESEVLPGFGQALFLEGLFLVLVLGAPAGAIVGAVIGIHVNQSSDFRIEG